MASSRLRVQLSCRGERLAGGAVLSAVEADRWRPHATACDLLQLDMTWLGAATPSPERVSPSSSQ